jgi:uncharacterized membrane protein
MPSPASVARAVIPAAPAARSSLRVASVDVLRGIAVVLMAIDHVRVYSGLPAGGPRLGIFFTRWMTHFVAPVFVFLAGTAAYLHGRKLGDRGQLARFLVVRGLWLVLLELTVIRVAWTFNADFSNYLLAGVIWAIGWSMVALAGLVFLPTRVIGAIGVAIVAGHNVLDIVARPHMAAIRESSLGWLWSLGYFAFEVGGTGPLVVLYALVPWVGVMAAGYAFGAVFTLDPGRRRRVCLLLGGAAVGLFVALRALDLYGDPRHWQPGPSPLQTTLSFLNTSKYPASLQFLLMTLGPALLLLPFLERPGNRVAGVLETFGRVPMFYYLLHIPLIHLLAVGVSLVRTGSVSPWLFENHPMGNGPPPPGYVWSLPLLYLVTGIAVALLYVACRWYARVKRESGRGWLRYL